MTPSQEGLPTKAHEVPSPHEVRQALLDTSPVFQCLGENTDTDFIHYIKSAEEKDGMSLVKKGNAFKHKSEETKSKLDILLNEGKNLMEKSRKLH